MRRFLGLIVIPVLAGLVLAGCGGAPNAVPGTTPSVNANAKVTVTGAFNSTPKVNFPNLAANNTLTIKTVIHGSGPALTKTDSLVANFVVYFWNGKTATLKANTFVTSPTIVGGQMISGLQTALLGQKVGSRILAIIPPAEGYGASGDSNIGVTGSTTLVWVIDVLKKYTADTSASGTTVSNGGNGLPAVSATPGQAPVVTIPAGPQPTNMQVKTLIKGTGPALVKGEYVIAQYVGYIWRTKKPFGSTWTGGGMPFGFIFQDPTPQVISGWDTGLAGQTVGSRVLLVIPPKDGYGATGASQAGIKGTDVLVYVVDILDAFTNSTASAAPSASASAAASASASSTG